MAGEQQMREMAQRIEALMSQNERLSVAHDQLTAELQQKIEAASAIIRNEHQRTNAELHNRLFLAEQKLGEAQRLGQGGDRRINLIDIKTMSPGSFSGKHREHFKEFARKFKAYCDGRCKGYKKALKWAELQKTPISTEDVALLEWPVAEEADTALTNLLLQVTTDEPNCIADRLDERGFEAWRQLVARYDPYDDTNELENMGQILSVKRCKGMKDVPEAVAQWERELRIYSERTDFVLPEIWKIKI